MSVPMYWLLGGWYHRERTAFRNDQVRS